MKQKYWKIREILSQVVILILLGISLIWIGKNIYVLKPVLEMKLIQFLFGFCLVLYVLICVSTVKSMIAGHGVSPYNPADPKSLKKLSQVTKYKLDPVKTSKLNQKGNIVQLVTEWLTEQGYQQVAKHRLGLIFERKTRFLNYKFKNKYHRVFLLYRPLLNVLIIDNILSEAASFIIANKNLKPVSQNDLILITDMKNEEEILSAGAGIVNYVGTERTSYLNPMFIDLNHAHLFYPQDNLLLPEYKRLAQFIKRKNLLAWISDKLNQNK